MRAFLTFSIAMLGCSARSPAGSQGMSDLGQSGDLLTPNSCTTHSPCPPGGMCFNGICYTGCAKDTDCRPGQYCDTTGDFLCHEISVSSCPDTPCATSQVCANGLCSTPPPGMMCGITSPFQKLDGCGHDAVCLANALVDGMRVPANQCYTFPSCSQDGSCPRGSVCNNGIFMDKGRMCLGGVCKVNADCLKGWVCVFAGDPSITYGQCTDGSSGSVCSKGGDCVSVVCNAPYPGAFGACK
jgi:hypothetical protein